VTAPAPVTPRLGGRYLTAWSLLALVAGGALGILLQDAGPGLRDRLAGVLGPVSNLWLGLLRVTVVPLVVTQVVVAILGSGGARSIGILGIKSILLFLGLLTLAAGFALLAAPPLIALYPVDPVSVAELREGVHIPEAARAAAGGGAAPSFGLPALVGTVLSTGGELLPLLLAAIALALLATWLAPGWRERILKVARPLAHWTLRVVGWILLLTPLGVFALTYLLALSAGWSAAGFMLAFVVIVSVVLVGFTLLLYPVTALAGRISPRVFARAVAPAQLVAVSSRSSLAALPALVAGGRDVLRLPVEATGFVLPLAVSMFKVNRTISAPVKLLFLLYVFGIPLTPGRLVVFILTVVLLSFVTVGVPGGGTAFRTLPAYLAAGAPIEGVVILEAVDAIPDIFKTLTNVTGDLSAAVILGRPRSPSLPSPAP
jgi:Na+/H+-dicarboxylate symporter